MITAEFCRTMARYNQWQNAGLRTAIGGLPEVELTRDRGAFFGSILATANHLLWGDTVWMSRFAGWEKPVQGIPNSVDFTADAAAWATQRKAADARIVAWTATLNAAQVSGDLSWFSGAAGRDVTKPMGLCVAHFFNHQTHHRGQLHTMLMQAGWRPGDTDLFLML